MREQLRQNVESFLVYCATFQNGFGFAELEARSAGTVADEKLCQQQIQQVPHNLSSHCDESYPIFGMADCVRKTGVPVEVAVCLISALDQKSSVSSA